MFEAFWEANQYDDLLWIQDVALDLRAALSVKSRGRSTVKLDELLESTDVLKSKMDTFLKECAEKSGL